MTPFVLALTSLIMVWGQNLSIWKKQVAKTHPLLTRTSESQYPVVVAANIYKIIQLWNHTAWYDLSKWCLPNKGQARPFPMEDLLHSSAFIIIFFALPMACGSFPRATLKRGPIGWASYLFWAWCPRHIVLSNIQVLTTSCSSLGNLPNFANAILKFVCSSFYANIFAIFLPCEGDNVYMIMS